ncbi:MAG: DUF302 domain-containing protein [Hyphomicrobiales bacterium]
MRNIVSGLLVLIFMAVPALANDDLVVKKSPHSVAMTLDKLTKVFESKGITIFARVDHAAGAKKVGAELRPTELLIFGNPKLGTPLMNADQKIGLDLPLKALAWQDADGTVWLAYTKPDALKTRHNIEGRDEVFMKMTGALNKLTDAALKAQ